jgi:hypothetical protein
MKPSGVTKVEWQLSNQCSTSEVCKLQLKLQTNIVL